MKHLTVRSFMSEDYPGDADSVVVAGATRLDDARWEQDAVE